MRKLFEERKLFKGGNYMRKYSILILLLDLFTSGMTTQIIECYQLNCYFAGQQKRQKYFGKHAISKNFEMT